MDENQAESAMYAEVQELSKEKFDIVKNFSYAKNDTHHGPGLAEATKKESKDSCSHYLFCLLFVAVIFLALVLTCACVAFGLEISSLLKVRYCYLTARISNSSSWQLY